MKQKAHGSDLHITRADLGPNPTHYDYCTKLQDPNQVPPSTVMTCVTSMLTGTWLAARAWLFIDHCSICFRVWAGVFSRGKKAWASSVPQCCHASSFHIRW